MHRFRYLIAAGLVTASAILGAPTAAAQFGSPAITPGSPGVPQSPNDPRCISDPGIGVCAGGPYAPSIPGSGVGASTIPGMPSF